MRKDIKHKISEVGCSHGKDWIIHNKRIRIRPVDYYNDDYDDRKYEPMRRDGSTCTRLEVAQKIIANSIGRKWDDVYSELCQNLKAGTYERYLLDDYIEYWIYKPLFIEGVPHSPDLSIFRTGHMELFTGDIYIDEDGYLRKYKRNPK